MKAKKEDQNDVPYRRRGRPTGKNRVPLSLEERRARNALYERERRNETAEAMAQLAEAVGCDANISNADLLATVISQIQRSTRNHSEQNIDDLIRINANLESQISMLQERLGLDDETYDQLENEGYQSMRPHSSSETSASSYCTREERSTRKQAKKCNRRSSSDRSMQEKRAKTKSETSTDSGVEMQNGDVSPTESYATDNTQCLASEQLQVPEEIIDENVSKTYVDLQAELYNQIYTSECQTTVQSIPDGTSLSEPCMASLRRSLIVVPSIVSPQEPPDLCLEQQTLSELSNVPIIESSCDNSNILNTDGECEILPRVEMTLDFLTDNERGLISDWLDGEFLETSAFNEQMPTASYNILSGGFYQ